jgi:muconolactone delta-isomerase
MSTTCTAAKRHGHANWRRRAHLLRLWRAPLQPGQCRSVGLFAADDDNELADVLASMPLHVWRTDEVTPLSPHPNDPVTSGC